MERSTRSPATPTPSPRSRRSAPRGSSASQPSSAPQLSGGDLWAAAGAALLAFVTYAQVMAPTLVGGSSASLVVAAAGYSDGLASSSPAWCVLAKLFMLVPKGDLAWRGNLCSVTCGALAIGLWVLLARLLEVGVPCALAGGLALAVSATLLQHAVLADGCTLALLLTVATLLALVSWTRRRGSHWLAGAVVLAAMSVGTWPGGDTLSLSMSLQACVEEQRAFVLRQWAGPAPLLLCGAAMWGLWVLGRRAKGPAWVVGGAALVLSLGVPPMVARTSSLGGAWLAEPALVPACACLMVMAVVAADSLPGGWRKLATGLLFYVVATSGGDNLRAASLRGNTWARVQGESMLGSLPPRAVLISAAGSEAAVLTFLQRAEAKRPDVLLLDAQHDIESGARQVGWQGRGDSLAFLLLNPQRPTFLTHSMRVPGVRFDPCGLLYHPVAQSAPREASRILDRQLWKGVVGLPTGGFARTHPPSARIMLAYEKAHGASALLQAESSRARKAFKEVRSLMGRDAALSNELGLMLTEAGDGYTALEYYRAAVDFEPTHVEARYNLVLTLLQTGEVDKARAAYEEGLRLACWSRQLKERLETLIASQDEMARELAQLADHVATHPGDAGAALRLGRLCRQRGLAVAATEALLAAVTVDSSLGPAWLELGDARYHLGDVAGARQAWQACADLRQREVSAAALKRLAQPHGG